MAMRCIEGVIEAVSSGQVEGEGPTMKRELVRVRDGDGKEIRIKNLLLTASMDTYLSSAFQSMESTKIFVGVHEGPKKMEGNILFAMIGSTSSYSEEKFWENEKNNAIKKLRIFSFCGWILAALVAYFFLIHWIAGVLISIIVVPILLYSKYAISKVRRRVNKFNSAEEMQKFIGESTGERKNRELI